MSCDNMNIRTFTPKSRRDALLLTVGFSLRSAMSEWSVPRAMRESSEPRAAREASAAQHDGQGEALISISVGQRPTEHGVSVNVKQCPTKRTTLPIPYPVRDNSSVEWIRAVAYRMPLGMRTYLTSVAYLRHAVFFHLLPFPTELSSLTGWGELTYVPIHRALPCAIFIHRALPCAIFIHRALPCAIFIHRALPCANEYKAFSLKNPTLSIANLYTY